MVMPSIELAMSKIRANPPRPFHGQLDVPSGRSFPIVVEPKTSEKDKESTCSTGGVVYGIYGDLNSVAVKLRTLGGCDSTTQKMGVPKPQQRFYTPSSHPFNNNYMFNGDIASHSITGFYKNAKIFITGATGFVDKALVEKLLRTCDELDSLYLLMRPKRGMNIEQRLKELLKNPVFNRIREKNPDAFDKVKAVAGDVSAPNLGLSDGDKEKLVEHCNIVFHSAATVKFNEDLKNAVTLNTLGTKQVLELCREMKNLKSFVHVSTAYSNSDKYTVDETVYEPPHDPNAVINSIKVLPNEGIEILSKKILGKHPNTYTLTKAMAEHLVLESSSQIPAAVVRPSIITAAWKEPYPGWVDNVSGITGIFMECGRGTIKSIICDDKCTMDLIPVDIVVNTIITAAWHTAAHPSNTMRVYNCTSGTTNPISWKEFGRLTQKYWLEYPSKYVTWYPGFTYRTSRAMHVICAHLFHLLPSAFLDVFLYCTKQKPIMLKISRKFYSALDAGKFFSTNEWDFKTSTMAALVSAVRDAEDGANFEIDMTAENGFNWNFYLKDFTLGVRQYVLKDDISSLPSAKVKLNRLYWFQKVFQAVTIYSIVKLALHQCT
nr:PREDICTED: fatty acyl-CoA reductase 1 isoform X1 [Tribolium castaneum]|eukprot:XP_008194927.2 PREDICTED: fatty acyl-CoA reductase 1 isoform X1 [Tribolium castaneum]